MYVAITGERAIFLDVTTGRFLALCDDENARALRILRETELPPDERARLGANLAPGMAQALLALQAQNDRSNRVIIAAPTSTGGAGWWSTGSALRQILQTRIRLKLCGLARTLDSLQRQTPVVPSHDLTAGVQLIIAAHARTGHWITRHDDCLVRSIALARDLAMLGCSSSLCIGVKSPPFAAHAWVQIGDHVLNDTAERVARFVPIVTL